MGGFYGCVYCHCYSRIRQQLLWTKGWSVAQAAGNDFVFCGICYKKRDIMCKMTIKAWFILLSLLHCFSHHLYECVILYPLFSVKHFSPHQADNLKLYWDYVVMWQFSFCNFFISPWQSSAPFRFLQVRPACIEDERLLVDVLAFLSAYFKQTHTESASDQRDKDLRWILELLLNQVQIIYTQFLLEKTKHCTTATKTTVTPHYIICFLESSCFKKVFALSTQTRPDVKLNNFLLIWVRCKHFINEISKYQWCRE